MPTHVSGLNCLQVFDIVGWAPGTRPLQQCLGQLVHANLCLECPNCLQVFDIVGWAPGTRPLQQCLGQLVHNLCLEWSELPSGLWRCWLGTGHEILTAVPRSTSPCQLMPRVVWTAFRSLTLLAGHRERHRVTKSWSMRYLQQCLGQTQPSTPPSVGHQKEYQQRYNQSRRCWSSLWWFVHYGKVQAKCAIRITGVQAGAHLPSSGREPAGVKPLKSRMHGQWDNTA